MTYMKKIYTLLSAILLTVGPSFALELDPQLQEARTALLARDIPAATAVFRNVVTEGTAPPPTVERARFGLAIIELLQVYEQPAARAVLDRWGFSSDGRDLYEWTSRSPVFETGEVIPEGANLEEVSGFFEDVLIPSLERFLELIGNGIGPAFEFSFNPNAYAWTEELAPIMVDFTDLVMMRAAAHLFLGAARLAVTSNEWDLPAEVIADLLEEEISPLDLLERHPHLSALQNPLERSLARIHLIAAIEAYLSEAAALTNPDRNQSLFFVDADGATAEAEFRDGLQQLRLALDGPTEASLGGANRDIIDGSVLFDSWNLREILPAFDDNGVFIDSFTDPTVGGLFPAFGLLRYAEILQDLGIDWNTSEWMGALPLQDDWLYLFWYGLWRELSGEWIYHTEHGFLHVTAPVDGGFFAFDTSLGAWSWTSSWIFPWTFYYGGFASGWTYHARGGPPGSRWFYVHTQGRWINESDDTEP